MSKSTLFEVNITFDSGVPVTANRGATGYLARPRHQSVRHQRVGAGVGTTAQFNRRRERRHRPPGGLPLPGLQRAPHFDAAFVCSRHFKQLPEKLQNLLKRAKSLGTAGFPRRGGGCLDDGRPRQCRRHCPPRRQGQHEGRARGDARFWACLRGFGGDDRNMSDFKEGDLVQLGIGQEVGGLQRQRGGRGETCCCERIAQRWSPRRNHTRR